MPPPLGLCKLSTHKTSKWITGAPTAGVGLALAAVGFVGTCRGGAGVWADSVAPTAGLSAQLLRSWYLTSVDLRLPICTGGFVNTGPEGHQGLLLVFPWLRCS